MRNHYHLAVETPEPNLVDGMHWLQSTFATRFNRFRSEQGHLFQGRYQALIIENDAALMSVIDYIHLNPVMAGIVSSEHVAHFRWSSLPRSIKGTRWRSHCVVRLLDQLGVKDSPSDWATYVQNLTRLGNDPAGQKRRGFDEVCRG